LRRRNRQWNLLYMLDPNQAYKDRELKGGKNVMMQHGQQAVLAHLCSKHNISLMTLTTRTLGHRKKTDDLTHTDAARCILLAQVWQNRRDAGLET
jgi:hypothetical protein